MWLICYASPVSMGGAGLCNIYEGMAAVVVLSLLTLYLAVASKLPDAQIAESYSRVIETTAD